MNEQSVLGRAKYAGRMAACGFISAALAVSLAPSFAYAAQSNDSSSDAVSAQSADEYTYGYANLTWAEYWANEDVYNSDDASSSDKVDSSGQYDRGGYDVVTRATTNHGLHRGSFQCSTTIYCTDNTSYGIASWTEDQKSFVSTDGETIGYSKGTLTTPDGNTHTLDHYEVYGNKYVPVAVKNEDLDAFKTKYTFVNNGDTLAGGYTESNLKSYTAVADVDANTNGLKTVTKEGDKFTFSKAAKGTTSGVKDQQLKTVTETTESDYAAKKTGIYVVVGNNSGTSKATNGSVFAPGSFGEFLRVDLAGDYGELGGAMQSVTWTYYGNDSTGTKPVRSFGTKFAADNWMHRLMDIQLGLTDSTRCQFPEGYDGTGYWTITVHALGYNDYTTSVFQVTEDNFAKEDEASEEEVTAFKSLVAKAEALSQADYTAASWDSFTTELKESKDLLGKDVIYAAELSEQTTHLQGAIDGLVKKAASEISLAAQSKTYNGKAQAYSGKATKSGSAGAVTFKYYSDSACTKEISAPTNAGTYYVKATVAADDSNAAATSDAAKFTIAKASNPVTAKAAKTKTVKAKKVKKAKQSVTKTITVKKAQGKVTYAKKSGDKKLSISKSGKVTVKKGTKKGTYKMKVKVKAAGNANYNAATKTVTIKVKVK